MNPVLHNFIMNLGFIGVLMFLVLLVYLVWWMIQEVVNKFRRSPQPFLLLLVVLLLCLVLAIIQTRMGDTSAGW